MTRLRILVSGMMAGVPHQGGATFAVLQYVLGLRDLGHDVYFVEPIHETLLRPSGTSVGASLNARYLRHVAARFDLTARAALLRAGTRETAGLPYERLVDIARRCDLLLNVSGMLTDTCLLEVIPRRVYLDLDPAFNQLWHAVEGIDMRFDGHTHFVTVGQAIGTRGCAVPDCGRAWIGTFQPIVLSEWPMTRGDARAAWTTVGHWRGYGSIRCGGVLYGQKAHSLRRILELPHQTREPVCLALSIDAGEGRDLAALASSGWHVIDPAAVAGTPGRYRRFIQQSKGELGIAKSGYVESQCGWFSDRSVCYLASGRPVVAQETGFSRFLPTGNGLFAYTTAEQASDALDAAGTQYRRHCAAAREIAETYFRADRVLSRLLDAVGASS